MEKTLKIQIQDLTLSMEDNTKAIVEKLAELKLINGDTKIAEKIEKLVVDLPAGENVEGVVEIGTREKFLSLCEDLKKESANEIAEINKEIDEIKVMIAGKKVQLKKWKKLDSDCDEAMGIIPEVVKEVSTEV